MQRQPSKTLRILSIAMLVVAAAGEPARSQSAIAAGAAVNGVIQQLRDGLKEVINETQNAYSRSAFDTRANAIIVLQNLDVVASGVTGRVFAELNAAEKKFMSDTALIIDQWHRGNRDLAERLESVATTGEEAISRLPFAERTPLVKKYSPSFVAVNASATFLVAIHGSRLGSGDPVLRFGSTACARNTHTDRELRFACPGHVLGSPANVVPVAARLSLDRPKSFWQSLRFWQAAEQAQYDIGVVAVPALLGEFTGRAVLSTTTREQQQRRGPRVGHRNDHCQGDRTHDWVMNASAGWRIDEGSVSLHTISCSSASTCPQLQNVSASGFVIHGVTINNGQCGPFGVPRDGRGSMESYATWTEYRDVEQDVDQPLAPGAIAWGSDTAIRLPANSKGFVLEVKRVDKTSSTITGAGPFDRFDVAYDQVTRTVVITPGRLVDALSR
jgi:hypothetical protein